MDVDAAAEEGNNHTAAEDDAVVDAAAEEEGNVDGAVVGLDEDMCMMCGGLESFDANPIVYCDVCDMCVHQHCYDVPASAVRDVTAEWKCDWCEEYDTRVEDPTCATCYASVDSIALRQSEGWHHACCLHHRNSPQGTSACEECGTGTGIKLRCQHSSGCTVTAHASCALSSRSPGLQYSPPMFVCRQHAAEQQEALFESPPISVAVHSNQDSSQESGAASQDSISEMLREKATQWQPHPADAAQDEGPIRIADFCCGGAGGFAVGACRLGGKIACFADNDQQMRGIYARTHKSAMVDEVQRCSLGNDSGDIDELSPDGIPRSDLWTAGFPCQPFSHAGSQIGLGDKKRGRVVLVLLELAKYRKPPMILLENVKSLLKLDFNGKELNGDVLGKILRYVERAGYLYCVVLLDSQWVGVPQHRERLYIACFRDSEAHERYI